MSLGFFGHAFKLAFEVSPIFLVGGIAAKIPGGVMPIAVLTEGVGIVNGLLHGDIGTPTTAFMPMAGTTLVQQEIGNMNFFNQATAANAVINRPNKVVMQMIKTAHTKGGTYTTKIAEFSLIKYSLEKHNQSGGSYTVLTPAGIYTNCLMRSMIDNSGFSEQNKQVQHTWTLEFEQPLLSISQTDAVLGGLMKKFESGMPKFQADTKSWWSNGDLVPAIPKL